MNNACEDDQTGRYLLLIATRPTPERIICPGLRGCNPTQCGGLWALAGTFDVSKLVGFGGILVFSKT